MISNVRYIDAAQTNIAATMDGLEVSGISPDAVSARSGDIASRIADWIAAGNQVAAYVQPAPTEADYQAAIQLLIDQTAQSRQYADGVALAGYINSTVPTWTSEATAFIAWRDSVWLYAYGELAKVQAGQRPQPSVAQILSELPTIAWPA
jgi:hypothetical protein